MIVWSNFKNYGEAPTAAFETLCNHLFERYIKREYGDKLKKFRVVNGKGGDGGVEAYAELLDGSVIAVQSKWFDERFDASHIGQIRNSIKTACEIRPAITQYFVCMRRNLTSLKFVAGGKDEDGESTKQITKNSGDQLIDAFEIEMKAAYENLTLVWWLEDTIEFELTRPENDGIHKFWFENEVLTEQFLKNRFELAKVGWLGEKYVPKLHALGFIESEISASFFDEPYRKQVLEQLADHDVQLQKATILSKRILRDVALKKDEELHLIGLIASLGQNQQSLRSIADKLKAALEPEAADYDRLVKDLHLLSSMRRVIPAPDNEGLLVRLEELFQLISIHRVHATLDKLKLDLESPNKTFLGSPGSGKTHALSHATDVHLQSRAPAVIVQAFNTPHENWGTILLSALQLNGWSMDQLFAALETQAVRRDRHLVNNSVGFGEELSAARTKVMVCVDGVEENTGNWQTWKHRIRECAVHTRNYSRLRFFLSARTYFYREEEASNAGIRLLNLPVEGDVSYRQLVPEYFKKENYNISISSYTIIRGLDSLFALRLFCETYQNQSLDESSIVLTAGNQLLANKIKQMEAEFAGKIRKDLGPASQPVAKSLREIANALIRIQKISHDELKNIVNPVVGSYLTGNETDLLIGYFADNGILIRNQKQSIIDGLTIFEFDYSMTYRSIPEMIIANRTVERITAGEITNISDDSFFELFNAVGSKNTSTEARLRLTERKRIMQLIVNILFHEQGKLVGQNGFLAKGLDDLEIFNLQFGAMLKAPRALVDLYKPNVDSHFFGSREGRMKLLREQILPASVEGENNFGASYLHDILSSFPSAYERDKIWQGPDRYEGEQNQRGSLRSAILGHSNELYLSNFALHNETPLIYAWALSTLDQNFRSSLRLSLTNWALKQPSEFAKLVSLLFPSADPQIQEDLASIALALAPKLKNDIALGGIAKAALENVFADPLRNRNVIVRAGFRAIVERAYQYQLISTTEVALAKPHQQTEVELINLDLTALQTTKEEIYPIVHDLAWYVIKKSYSGFLKIPDGTGPRLKDRDSKEAKALLDRYRNVHPDFNLYAYEWAMAAAIGYMRSLGFDRSKGNGYTDESHGGKSKLFTYEEKYTWLAVHYIKGYLADYMPHRESGEESGFLDDYFRVVHVPNPGEGISDSADDRDSELRSLVIQENLIEEFDKGDIATYVSEQVSKERKIDFEKWLLFNESQFFVGKTDRPMLALYNDTTQKDNNNYIYANIEAIAVFISTEQIGMVEAILDADAEQFSFAEHLDSLFTSPKTATYTNATDIVWMNWIGEYSNSDEYETEDGPLQVYYALTKVASTNSRGENHMVIPSKLSRELGDITSMAGNYFKDKNGEIAGFYQHKGERDDGAQEMALVNREIFEKKLAEAGLSLAWFIHVYKSKEHHDRLKDIPHVQWSRKYFVRFDGQDKLQAVEFWNERTSNVRDEFSWETILSLSPTLKEYGQLTQDEIGQITRMLSDGGEVNVQTLTERLKAIKKLAFFENNGHVIAIAAVKKPLANYRNGVFAKAQLPGDAQDFDYELGYLYTLPRARGKKLSSKLTAALLREFDGEKIYATTRMSNIGVHFLLEKMSFECKGNPYLNASGNDNLLLYTATVDASRLPTDFPIH
ncbi:MAG TPA: GNAT family N-acetyltransferase [Bacteroidetes bacterium]|nr:GNAT family N-acetyltransferase [Bacteroidota bacterium]